MRKLSPVGLDGLSMAAQLHRQEGLKLGEARQYGPIGHAHSATASELPLRTGQPLCTSARGGTRRFTCAIWFAHPTCVVKWFCGHPVNEEDGEPQRKGVTRFPSFSERSQNSNAACLHPPGALLLSGPNASLQKCDRSFPPDLWLHGNNESPPS